ncbi:MAG: PKD domain-containing protein [Bacteroidales bacterium]
MHKLFNYRFFIVLLSIGLVVALTFLARSCMYEKKVEALVSSLEVELGESIVFSDSTRGANSWLWEFGNGDSSEKQQGEYTFSQTGKYQVRLRVDNDMVEKFVVNVRLPQKSNQSEIVTIDAPSSAYQGEFITFKGDGSSKSWRWEFGETGRVDAMERIAIYKYTMPGRYMVMLQTEETKYPVMHEIEIIPSYSEGDTTDIYSIIGNDIREKLQNIVDQKSFNKNYNYILDTYLCGDSKTLVVVNNDKKNDFYSYCQGLKIIGRHKVEINNVLIDISEDQQCVTKLLVMQTDE